MLRASHSSERFVAGDPSALAICLAGAGFRAPTGRELVAPIRDLIEVVAGAAICRQAVGRKPQPQEPCANGVNSIYHTIELARAICW